MQIKDYIFSIKKLSTGEEMSSWEEAVRLAVKEILSRGHASYQYSLLLGTKIIGTMKVRVPIENYIYVYIKDTSKNYFNEEWGLWDHISQYLPEYVDHGSLKVSRLLLNDFK